MTSEAETGDVAKRMECDQLAGAFERCRAPESGSKLHALQTLRAIWLRLGRSASIAPLRFRWACFHCTGTAKEKPEFPQQEGLSALHPRRKRAFHRAYANAVPILSQAVIESPFRKGRNPGSCLPRAAKEGLPRSTCQRWPSHTRTASMSPTFLKRPQSAKLEKAIKSNLGGLGYGL